MCRLHFRHGLGNFTNFWGDTRVLGGGLAPPVSSNCACAVFEISHLCIHARQLPLTIRRSAQ